MRDPTARLWDERDFIDGSSDDSSPKSGATLMEVETRVKLTFWHIRRTLLLPPDVDFMPTRC
jgi:hypothetical protein